MELRCPQCNSVNSPENEYCTSCNAPLKPAMQAIKKRRRLILLFLLAGVLIYGIVALIKWQQGWTEHITRIIPVDVNKDGTDDLVICYGPHKDKKQSLVRALDLKNDSVLWERKIFSIEEGALAMQQYIAADDSVLVLMQWHGLNRIAALDNAGGEVLWQKKTDYETYLFNTIFIVKDLVLIFYRNEDKKLELVALNKNSGAPAWNIVFGKKNLRGLQTPLLVCNRLFLPFRDSLVVVDPLNGKTEHEAAFSYAKIWEWRGKPLILNMKNTGLYRYDPERKTLLPYMASGRHFSLNSPLSSHYAGLYKDSLIYVKDISRRVSRKEHIRQEELHAVSLFTGRTLYRKKFPEGYAVIYELGKSSPSGGMSYFRHFPERFFPLLLLDFRSKEPDHYHYRWAILDLEEGEVSLPGKELATQYRMCRQIIRSGSDYIFDLRMNFHDNKNEEFLTVFFDAHTGKFNHIYNNKYNESYHYYRTPYHSWQLKGDVLYGYSLLEAEFWAIDMKTKKMLYTDAGGLRLKNGRQEFTAFFGIH